MDYSTLRLQTSASVIEEGLVYSKSKRPLLADSEKSHMAIKLKRCSYTSGAKKFIVDNITEISVPKPTDYSFQFNEELEKASLPLSVQGIIANANIGDFVNTCVKVMSIGTPSTLPDRNRKVVTTKVADNAGTIDLDLWGNNMLPVQVRHWMGKKKLSTVFTSAFTLDSKNDIQAVAVKHDEKDKATTINFPGSILLRKLNFSGLKCVKCLRKVIQPTSTPVVHCDRCGYFMRSGDCEKGRYDTIVVNPGDGRCPYLTVFN